MAKTLWSFDRSEFNRVKQVKYISLTSESRPEGYNLSKYSEALVARGNNSCSTVLYVREATFTL